MGIPIDENTKRQVFGASGMFESYGAKIGVEIRLDKHWHDIGVINVHSPDTEWSRDPRAHLPFIPGLHGFFDKFDMRINHSKKAVWLEPAAARSI